MMKKDTLLAPTFLFHFSAPLFSKKTIWSKSDVKFTDKHRLPAFGELEGRESFADVRGAWNEKGLTFVIRIAGKTQTTWCRSSRVDDSDGLHLYIDTRDTQNIHRATRFCHQFIFLPFGDGPGYEEPYSALVPIHRAREQPRAIGADVLQVRSQRLSDGYVMEAHIPAKALTGFEPQDHPRLGFTYAVVDRQLGLQTFTVGNEFRFQEDPSLWATLDLEA